MNKKKNYACVDKRGANMVRVLNVTIAEQFIQNLIQMFVELLSRE